MILHICPRSVWAAVGDTYEGDTLATQGYLHFSTEEQVHIPATILFRGRTDLLLLEVDESRLPLPITWEQGDGAAPGSDPFPHYYGPMPTAAVIATHDYQPEPDGSFRPPRL